MQIRKALILLNTFYIIALLVMGIILFMLYNKPELKEWRDVTTVIFASLATAGLCGIIVINLMAYNYKKIRANRKGFH